MQNKYLIRIEFLLSGNPEVNRNLSQMNHPFTIMNETPVILVNDEKNLIFLSSYFLIEFIVWFYL